MGLPTDVFAGLKACMLTMTPATDSNAPARYAAVPGLAQLVTQPGDRLFTIQLGRDRAIEMLDVTGEQGEGDYQMRFSLLTRHRNEGRSQIDFEAILAEEHFRIINRVFEFFQGNGAGVTGYTDGVPGVTNCICEGVDIEQDEKGRLYFSDFNLVATFDSPIPTP